MTNRNYTAVNTASRQRGLSLIELMIAVVISLLLLAGVIQIFMSNKQTYRLQEASAYVQEAGRFGFEFMSRDVRMVGFMGCANSRTVPTTNNVDPTKHTADLNNTVGAFTGQGSLHGYHYDGTTFPADMTAAGLTAGEVVAGTDILFVERAVACPGGDVVCHNNTNNPGKTCPGVSGNTNSAEYKIADNTFCQVMQNDILLISNCQTADIHAVTNNPSGSIHVTIAHGANFNKSPKLTNSYGEGSSIYKMSVAIYYVGFGASGQPALFRRILRGVSFINEELVEGVYDMALLYGEDTDGDRIANRYVIAANVADWDAVVSTRLTLNVRSSQDNMTSTGSTYSYNGANVTDRRLRRDFTTTIGIRNRI